MSEWTPLDSEIREYFMGWRQEAARLMARRMIAAKLAHPEKRFEAEQKCLEILESRSASL